MASKDSIPEDCAICCEKYDHRAHTKVECPKCNFLSCKKCIQTYILSQTNDPHCMNCAVGFTEDFLYANMNKTFVNVTLKKEQNMRIVELEKARLPESMHDVARMEELKIPEKIKENEELQKDMFSLREAYIKAEIAYRAVQDKIATNEYTIQNAKHIILNNKQKKDNQFKFIQPCPVTDCRGYLSKAWKCQVCSTWACSKCFEVIGDTKDTEHVCKKENLASAEEIRKSTKPCPDCGTRIYKISGCDQMWCTQCKIGFSWKTGARAKGVIHNPHFFEYQRNGGNVRVRNPGDMVCGGVPHNWRPHSAVLNTKTTQKEFDFMSKIVRAIGHNEDIILNRLRQEVNRGVDHRTLRFEYLMKEIDERKFVSVISRKNTQRRKSQALLHIVELFQTVLVENLNAIVSIPMIQCVEPHVKPVKNDDEKYVGSYGRTTTYYHIENKPFVQYFNKKDWEAFYDQFVPFYVNCKEIVKYTNEQFAKYKKNTGLSVYHVGTERNPFIIT